MSEQEGSGLVPQEYPSAFNQSVEKSSFNGVGSPWGTDLLANESPLESPNAFGATAALPSPPSAFGGAASLNISAPVSTAEPAVLPPAPAPLVSTSFEPALSSSSAFSGPLPLITPDQITDPVLRAKLSGTEQNLAETGAVSADAFGTASLEAATTSMQPTVYPSASPQTVSMPLTEYKRKPAPSRSRLGQSLKSFVSSQQNLTKPLRGIDNVAQRQFTLSAQRRREQYIQEKEQAREVLNFTVRLAETMFHYGADARDVDSAIVAVCAAYGLDDVEVNVTNQSVIVNYISDPFDGEEEEKKSSPASLSQERFSHTVVRVVRTRSDNYSSLTSIYALIHNITEKGLSRQKAERRLKEINRSKKLYSPMTINLSHLMMIGCFTIGLGGSWRAALVAVLAAIVALVGINLGSKLSLPSFFQMAIGSGIITAGALWVGSAGSFAQEMGFYVSTPHMVAAGLLLLLPTSMMVSAAQDALTGYPLTAAGKFVTTALDFLGLVVGIAFAVTAMSYLGAATLDIQQTVFSPPPLWVSILGMMLGSVATVVSCQGTPKNMMWIFILSGVGQGVYHGMTALSGVAPNTFTTAVGAFTVGALSALIAYRLRAPQLAFYVPGFLFLLPGLSIFRGLYSVVVDPSPVAGMSMLVAAFSAIIAMASGVVLGSYVVQYMLQQMVQKQDPEKSPSLIR